MKGRKNQNCKFAASDKKESRSENLPTPNTPREMHFHFTAEHGARCQPK